MPYVTLFLLFVLPIIVLPLGYSFFETPKVFLAEGIIGLMFFWKIYKKGWGYFSKLNLLFYGLCLTLILISLLQLIFLPDHTVFGNVFRLQGTFMLWGLIAFGLLSSTDTFSRSGSKIALAALIFLFLTALLYGQNQSLRTVGALGEPNALGAVAVFIFPFVYFRYKFKIKILATILVSLIILLSGSRSSLIAFVIEGVFIFLVNYKNLPVKKAGIICLSLVFFSYALPFLESSLKESIKPNQYNFENRTQIWQTALNAGLKSPFLGVGFGNNQQAINQSAKQLNNIVQYQIVDSSHNIFLDFLLSGGIFALLILTLLIFFSFKGLLESWAFIEATAFLGILTTLSFNPLSVIVLLQFWWLLGQGFNHKHPSITLN